jgi:tripartite-type tricarboxylate transporter receptor subunit TctC
MRTSGNTLLAALAVTLAAGAVSAQTLPNKPIHMVIPFPVGSGTDLTFRPVVEHMTKTLGQTVLLEGRPGGGGVVASIYVRSQPPDGSTIYNISNTTTIRSLGPKPEVDVRRDFTAIAPSNIAPMLITVNSEQVKARTLAELIAEARSRPGQINYASYGVGSGSHLFFEMLKNEAKINMVHVPYQGDTQAATETAAGRTQVTGTILGAVRPLLAETGGSGRLRLIGQSLAERSKLVPNTPGMKESGVPQIDYGLWGGYVGPPGMQRNVVDVLNRALNAAMTDPGLLATYERLGISVIGGTPEELTRMINLYYDAYTKLLKDTGLKLE